MSARSVVLALLLAAPSAAFAAPGIDLSVRHASPSVRYGEVGRHVVTVRNAGPKSASGVTLNVKLPRTGTSPQVYVLGELGARDGRCTVSGTELNCALGTLGKGASTSAWFDFTQVYSTRALTIVDKASASVADANPANDSVTVTLAASTYPVAVVPAAPATNAHCTGGATLSSFYECELFPSSIAVHDTVFEAGGAISFPGITGAYTGEWSQPAADRLHFRYFDGGSLVATFDGVGVDPACFEGVTVFEGSTYVAPYRVCLE